MRRWYNEHFISTHFIQITVASSHHIYAIKMNSAPDPFRRFQHNHESEISYDTVYEK